MSDAFIGTAYIAFAAACMSRGLTPTETDNLWQRLEPQYLPSSAGAMQTWLEEAINQLRSERINRQPELQQSPDLYFPPEPTPPWTTNAKLHSSEELECEQDQLEQWEKDES